MVHWCRVVPSRCRGWLLSAGAQKTLMDRLGPESHPAITPALYSARPVRVIARPASRILPRFRSPLRRPPWPINADNPAPGGHDSVAEIAPRYRVAAAILPLTIR